MADRTRFPPRLKRPGALVTGGSRGLGLFIARHLAERGCTVTIAARDAAELDRAAGHDGPVLWIERAVEQHGLDADVVVEPLQMTGVGHGRGDVGVQMWGAVTRDVQPEPLGDGRRAQPHGDAAAAGHVGLKAVDGSGGRHPSEVRQVVAVLTGRDVRGDGIAHLVQPAEVVGGDGFLEPDDAEVCHDRGYAHGLFAGVATVRVDVQLRRVAHGAAGQPGAVQIAGLLPAPGFGDLDFHAVDALLGPAAQLLFGVGVIVRGEAAAAVHRDLVARRAQQSHQGQSEQARLEVPQGGVDGGDGAGRDAGPAGVAHGPAHAVVGGGDSEGVLSDDEVRELVLDDLGCGGRPVRPADAPLARRGELDQDEGRGVPGEPGIPAREIGGDAVHRDGQVLHGRAVVKRLSLWCRLGHLFSSVL